MPSSTRKKSFVWKYFHVSEEDERNAICNSCGAVRKRGSDSRNYSTTTLAAHLKRCGKLSLKDRTHFAERPKKNVKVLLVGDRSQDTQDDISLLQEAKESNTQTPINTRRSTGDLYVSRTTATTPKRGASEEYVRPDPKYRNPDVICTKRMDLIHSGLLLHTLYQQHRCGKLCDLTLISDPTTIAPQPASSIVASNMGSQRKIFKAHSSVLAALSKKVKALIEMGSRTIELKDVSPFGLKSLLEIAYTGKLAKSAGPLRWYDIHQIWKAARDLGMEYVRNYLMQEHPQVIKWILDEEKQPEKEESYVEDVGGALLTQEDDLIDMCRGGVSGVEPMDQTLENPEEDASSAEESLTIRYDESTGGAEGLQEDKDADSPSLVEITFNTK